MKRALAVMKRAFAVIKRAFAAYAPVSALISNIRDSAMDWGSVQRPIEWYRATTNCWIAERCAQPRVRPVGSR